MTKHRTAMCFQRCQRKENGNLSNVDPNKYFQGSQTAANKIDRNRSEALSGLILNCNIDCIQLYLRGMYRILHAAGDV